MQVVSVVSVHNTEEQMFAHSNPTTALHSLNWDIWSSRQLLAHKADKLGEGSEIKRCLWFPDVREEHLVPPSRCMKLGSRFGMLGMYLSHTLTTKSPATELENEALSHKGTLMITPNPHSDNKDN